MIPERVLAARRKILEGLLTLDCSLPDNGTESIEKFNHEWLRFVTGETELSDLRMAFARLRQSAYALAREEWKEDLRVVRHATPKFQLPSEVAPTTVQNLGEI